jgi:hypothetical protein
MAISPGLSLPRSCARAGVPFANKPTPTVAAPPARRPLFIKERRSTGRLVLLTGFFMFAPTIGEIKDFCFSNKEELAWNEFIPRRGNKSFSSQFARQENLFMEATYQWNRFELPS